MSINYILGGFATFAKLRSSCDDDWVDRLNHLYTVIILTVFAVFVGYGQFLGNPIECFCPPDFSAARVAYVKSLCWVKNTYYVHIDEVIPSQEEHRKSTEIPYYQWVPIILLFMAFLFKLPSVFWRLLNGATGLSLDKLVTMAVDTQLCPAEKSEETIRHIAQYINRWLQAHRDYHWNICVRIRHRMSRLCCCMCGKRDGVYLTRLYVFIKLLYIVVVLSQLYLLNAFLGQWYSLYGFEVINSLMADNSDLMLNSPRFPFETLCDFKVRQFTNVQPYTIHCNLPYNILNERIFAFLWFWYVCVATITIANFLFWIVRNNVRVKQFGYVKKYLKVMDELHGDEDRKLARKFAEQYLRSDGIFVLRVVGKNTNEIVLGDIIQNLWRLYKNNPMMEKTARRAERGDYMAA
ncbi:innexin unc-9-like [Haliotis rubra]|uniref:innexin unc-9-like n=1 Tax=Haliotis rubra TaxID=36100 RepID=UPI001EE60A10|nr:innexin unc-9-like [Haliotis rubra]